VVGARPAGTRKTVALAVCLALTIWPLTARGVERSASPIRSSGSGASLAAALEEVARAAGVTVEGLEHVAGDGPATTEGPVDVALRRLLRSYSFVFFEDDRGATLRILGPSGAPSPVDAPGTAPAAARVPSGLWGSGAVEGLARIVGEEGLRVLLDAAASPDLGTRLEALSGVAQYDAPEAAAVLGAAVRDPDPAVRHAAVQYLAGSGLTAVPHLLEVFRDARDPELRVMALSTIAGLGGAVSEDLLALAARDPDAHIRAQADLLRQSLALGSSGPDDEQ